MAVFDTLNMIPEFPFYSTNNPYTPFSWSRMLTLLAGPPGIFTKFQIKQTILSYLILNIITLYFGK